MSEIPSLICVFGQEITVKCSKRLPTPKKKKVATKSPTKVVPPSHFWDQHKSVIFIDSSLDLERQISAFYAGVLEAINSLHKIGLSQEDTGILSQALYTLFRDCAMDVSWRPILRVKNKKAGSPKSSVKPETTYADIGSDIAIIKRP